MRKAGTLAPEIDEDGNMVNPHIPQYMSVVSRTVAANPALSCQPQQDTCVNLDGVCVGAVVSERQRKLGSEASEGQ